MLGLSLGSDLMQRNRPKQVEPFAATEFAPNSSDVALSNSSDVGVLETLQLVVFVCCFLATAGGTECHTATKRRHDQQHEATTVGGW